MFLPADPPTAAVSCPACRRVVSLRVDVELVDGHVHVPHDPLVRAMRVHLRVCDPPRVETLTP